MEQNPLTENITCIEALVASSDLSNFARFARQLSEIDLFAMLSQYYELIGDIIGRANGRVIKFTGDANLLLFPSDSIDEGVLALLSLKEKGDEWLNRKNIPSRHHLKAHFGSVVCGEIGTRKDKRFDIFGSTVNTMFLQKTYGFSMTPQLFRKLSNDTRKHFKKHTPPVTYILIDEPHKD